MRPRRGTSPNARLVLAIFLVVLGLGLTAVLAGGFGTASPRGSLGTSPAASPAITDLHLVPVAPTIAPDAANKPGDSGSVPRSTSALPTADRGVPANRIKIVQRGIDLAIIEGDGLDAPIGKAAHFPGSAWPGAGSNVYIYGHAREGMFINFWQAEIGDTIELDLVDGTSRAYVVTKVLPKVPWDAVEYLEPTPTEQLTVQTSTSNYPTAPRFIVIAIPAP